MGQTFLTGIEIKKVRHLENIEIPLHKEKRKHLILTGKNGSGKTSVLEELAKYFQDMVLPGFESYEKISTNMDLLKEKILEKGKLLDTEESRKEIRDGRRYLEYSKKMLEIRKGGAISSCTSLSTLQEKYKQGKFIFAYYKAERELQVETYKNIEKVELKNQYDIDEKPGEKLTKYLVDLKAMQAFAKDSNRAAKIEKWFNMFENILKSIFEDEHLKLQFNDETFQFTIHQTDREVFDFNTMSSGYAAIFDIINDLIMRMEAQSGLRTEFDAEGVILIDEIETHLHLELQKKILPILTELFPDLQFIITTHSPFILSSLDNAVIYDLENKTLVENGLKNLPYKGIIEVYVGEN